MYFFSYIKQFLKDVYLLSTTHLYFNLSFFNLVSYLLTPIFWVLIIGSYWSLLPTGIRVIDYGLATSILIFVPIILGRQTFVYLIEKLHFDLLPHWVVIPVYWLLGSLSLQVPVIIMSITKIDHLYTTLCWWVLVFILNLWWVHYNYEFDNSETQLQIKNAKIRRSERLHTSEILLLSAVLVIVAAFYIHWGSITEFISFNSDNPQNVHLANIFRFEKIWSVFAYYITPQSTTIQYTTIMTPIMMTALEFFDYREVMFMMYPFEVIVTLLITVQRFYLFRFMKISNVSSALLAALSSILTFGGIYVPGTFYNQQVLVLLFPTILYLTSNRRWIFLIATFLLLSTVHMTMLVFMGMFVAGYYVLGTKWWQPLPLLKGKISTKLPGAYWLIYAFVNRILHSFSQWFDPRWFYVLVNVGKVILLILFYGLVYLAVFHLFDMNFSIVNLLLTYIDSPQFSSTIDLYSNMFVIQILAHGLGPILTLILLISPLAWLLTNKIDHQWPFFACTLQLIFIIAPFPVSHRTITFFSIPMVLAFYYAARTMFRLEKFVHIVLLIGIVSILLWNNTVKAYDQDIIGNYGNLPYISRSMVRDMNSIDSIFRTEDIDMYNMQIVSEYFTKHYTEVASYKRDDKGTYVEDADERIENHRFLNNRSEFEVCEYFDRKYISFVINNRTYKWKRVPELLASKFSYAVWFSKPTNEIERAYIRDFYPKHEIGYIVLDRQLEETRLITIQCYE